MTGRGVSGRRILGAEPPELLYGFARRPGWLFLGFILRIDSVTLAGIVREGVPDAGTIVSSGTSGVTSLEPFGKRPMNSSRTSEGTSLEPSGKSLTKPSLPLRKVLRLLCRYIFEQLVCEESKMRMA